MPSNVLWCFRCRHKRRRLRRRFALPVSICARFSEVLFQHLRAFIGTCECVFLFCVRFSTPVTHICSLAPCIPRRPVFFRMRLAVFVLFCQSTLSLAFRAVLLIPIFNFIRLTAQQAICCSANFARLPRSPASIIFCNSSFCISHPANRASRRIWPALKPATALHAHSLLYEFAPVDLFATARAVILRGGCGELYSATLAAPYSWHIMGEVSTILTLALSAHLIRTPRSRGTRCRSTPRAAP